MILHQRLRPYRLILASNSPRRRELMTSADLEFTMAEKFDVPEIYPFDTPAHNVPSYLSELKSNGYPHELEPSDILITADTVVIIDNCVLGKPTSEADAFEMLSRLSGRTHKVVTAVTLRSTKIMRTFSASSEVDFRELDSEEIQYYISKYRPMDKAGAYGIQEWIGCTAIRSIRGSFYNVMGLPIQMLYQELKQFLG